MSDQNTLLAKAATGIKGLDEVMEGGSLKVGQRWCAVLPAAVRPFWLQSFL